MFTHAQAITAIAARIHGQFDNEELLKIGFLRVSVIEDINYIMSKITDTDLSPLETELLAIVRSMSNKLSETAIFLRDQHPNSINDSAMAADCDTYADYSGYLEQFPIMKQFNFR